MNCDMPVHQNSGVSDHRTFSESLMKSDLYGGSGKRENTNSNYLDKHYPKNMYPNK